MTRAFAGLMIVLVLMLGVYYLSLITPTIVPPPPDTPTPTPITALPPTPTPPPLLPTPTSTTTPAPTVVAQPEVFVEDETPTPPAAAPTRNLSVGSPPNCPNPAARITQPGDGSTVIGLVQVQGSAAIDNFEYYKFEFQDPGTGEWVFVSRFDNPVSGGVLGAWNSDTVPPGSYQFRLVVVDRTGNFPAPCQVTFQVQ